MGRRYKGPVEPIGEPVPDLASDASDTTGSPPRKEPPATNLMGAVCLPAPGGSCGPCTDACEHVHCGIIRTLAARPCPFCGEPNGFKTALYAYATRCGHADCIDGAYQKAIEAFVAALAHLLAEDLMRRIRDGSLSNEPRSDEAQLGSPPHRSRSGEESSSERYMLPEFDIDLVVPTVGKRRSGWRIQGRVGKSGDAPRSVRDRKGP
jgi:hypothetical protein